MSKMQVLAHRGGANLLNNLFLSVDDNIIELPLGNKFNGTYNIRFIFENVDKKLSYPDNILGDKLIDSNLGCFLIHQKSEIIIQDNSKSVNTKLDLNFDSQEYFVGIKVYEDKPINHHGVLDTIPVPTEILNIYIYFSTSSVVQVNSNKIEKYFDGYSHLGFFLADIPKMKHIIFDKYGEKKLDLVKEFSNSDIIDKLFSEEIIMIVWGINPFTYPIYSSENIDLLKPLLGEEFSEEGIFNINENINELSIVPGYELENWPDFLKKEWTKIKLAGKGKKTYLKVFRLQDTDNETVITSFVIYREEGVLEESKPLMNVDILY